MKLVIKMMFILLIIMTLTVRSQSLSCLYDPGCAQCNVYIFPFPLMISFLQCDECKPTRVLNQTSGTCNCSYGYYDQNSTVCAKCNQLCSSCQNQNFCTSCNPQYNRVIINGQCQCQDGYESKNNSAFCTKRQNILLIILSSVGCILFCFLLSFIFYRICAYKKRQQQQIHDMSDINSNQIHKNTQSVQVYLQGSGQAYLQNNSTTPSSFWNTKQYEFKQDEICSICLDSRPLFMTDCGHYFHSRCIYNWLNGRTNCPNCNKQINSRDLKRWCQKCHRTLMPVIVNVSLKRSGKGKRQIVKSTPVQHQICYECQSQINEKQNKQMFN